MVSEGYGMDSFLTDQDKIGSMGTLKKFSSQMDEKVFRQLEGLSAESNEEISTLLT